MNVGGGRVFHFDFILRAVTFLSIKEFCPYLGLVPTANEFTLSTETVKGFRTEALKCFADKLLSALQTKSKGEDKNKLKELRMACF